MTDDTRPAWPHKEMTERSFRAIMEMGRITSVQAKWEMTGADTSREWMVVTNVKGQSFRLPDDWAKSLKFVGHASVPGLFAFTQSGENMRVTLSKIDAWEVKNAADRADYERLKAKFEGCAND